MNTALFSGLKAHNDLLQRLSDAKAPSKNEIEAQRVSFVFGMVDKKAKLTKEQVRKIVESEA